MRGQKTCFYKKKRFKILPEIDQIYGDGRGFQNLACLRSNCLPQFDYSGVVNSSLMIYELYSDVELTTF